METLASLLPLILIIAVFYLLIMRPARNRQRQVQKLQAQVGIGARVVTTGGLYGTVVEIDEDTVVLDTGVSPLGGFAGGAGGPRSRWARGAVGRVLEPAPEAATGSLAPIGESAGGGSAGSPRDHQVDLTKPVTVNHPDSDGGPTRT